MPGFLGALAQQAAGQATGGAIAMGIQRLGVNYDNRKQAEQAQRLQDIQIAGEKQLMDYQSQKQLQMWQDTSYGAQKAQMQKAGINPALMYGMGGGGGQSMGGGIPSVGGASAQSPNTAKAGGEGMGIMTSAQLQLMQAQADALKAQANKTNAEIPNVSKTGANIDTDTALKDQQRQNLIQGVENMKAQKLLTDTQTKATDLANQITAASKNDQIAMWAENLDKLVSESRSAAAYADINEKTLDDKVKQIKAEAVGAVIDNVLKTSQTKLTEQEIVKMKQDVINSIRSLDLTQGGQRIEMAKAQITKTLGQRGLDIAQQGVIIAAADKVMGVIANATK